MMTDAHAYNDPPPMPVGTVDLMDYIDGTSAFMAGVANVIVQLSLRPVGYGVVESKVTSGALMVHPIKRLRTTLTYIAVAASGSDQERAAYREAVNQSHRQVRSGPNSPVKYNAFDPKLQLWVAAAIAWGVRDLAERLHGPLDDDAREALHQASARFGTTLQVPQEMWPHDRAAFDKYFDETLAALVIDPPVRDYFNDLIDLKMLPYPVRFPFASLHRFFVAGLLPQHLRDQMGLQWSETDERRFGRIMRSMGAVNRRLPDPVRLFPLNIYLWDLRRRMRLNRPLV
jgi:uncharacterized protein (DUF2236 family)